MLYSHIVGQTDAKYRSTVSFAHTHTHSRTHADNLIIFGAQKTEKTVKKEKQK